MDQLLEWLTQYSPTVVLLIALGAGLLFVIRLVVERSIAAGFDARSMVFATQLERRASFEDRVLTERYLLITGLSTRLERILTNLNRMQTGHPVPEGFMREQEIVPLTEVFEDLEIHRLALGEQFYAVFQRQARLALGVANSRSAEDWSKHVAELRSLRAEIRAAVDEVFGISGIR